MLLVQNIREWFTDKLQHIDATPNATAYVINVLASMACNSKTIASYDLSSESIVLAYIAAKHLHSFDAYVRIGDWILYRRSTNLIDLHRDDVEVTMARLSYYTCYRMMGKSWIVYEELADNFVPFTKQVASKITVQQGSLSSPSR